MWEVVGVSQLEKVLHFPQTEKLAERSPKYHETLSSCIIVAKLSEAKYQSDSPSTCFRELSV